MFGQILQQAMLTAGQGGGVGQFAHALDEQPGGQQQAHPDRQHHVEQHRQHQASQQHQHIAARRDAQRSDDVRGFAHVPGHHDQQSRQRGHRQVAEQGRQPENRHQHDAGVDDGGQGRAGTGAHVGGAAGNGCGGGDAAEQRRDQIADALTEQFGVGIVLAAGHAVGDHRAEQRFDGAEHGDGERRREQLVKQLEVQRQRLAVGARQQPGPGEVGQQRRNAGVRHAVDAVAETFTQRGHGQARRLQCHRRQRADHQRDQMPRDLRYQTRPDNQHGQAQPGDQRIAGLYGRQRPGQLAQLVEIVLWLCGEGEPERILELQGRDDDTDAGRKAQGDRIGHEGDQLAGAQQTQRNKDQPGEHGAQQQAAEAELLSDRQQDHHERGGRPRHVETRAPGQRNQRRGHQHRIQTMLRRNAHGDRQGHGQRNGDDADRQACYQVAAQFTASVARPQGLAPGGEQRRKLHSRHSLCAKRQYRLGLEVEACPGAISKANRRFSRTTLVARPSGALSALASQSKLPPP